MSSTNPCKLTECQGKPRCPQCTAMDKRYGPPATPTEAEELAKKAVGDYLTACRLAIPDPATMANVAGNRLDRQGQSG